MNRIQRHLILCLIIVFCMAPALNTADAQKTRRRTPAAEARATAQRSAARERRAREARERSAASSEKKRAGTSANGRRIDPHGNVVGGSGKPRSYNKNYSSRKQAQQSAKKASGTHTAVHHPTPKRGGAHFHPADARGQKVPGSPHYNYPKNR